MTLIGVAHTERLVVGVRLPTDCGVVLLGRAVRAQIRVWRGVGERLVFHLYPVCASELLPKQSRKPFPIISSALSLLYFPL